jgi:hypothetical protein
MLTNLEEIKNTYERWILRGRAEDAASKFERGTKGNSKHRNATQHNLGKV